MRGFLRHIFALEAVFPRRPRRAAAFALAGIASLGGASVAGAGPLPPDGPGFGQFRTTALQRVAVFGGLAENT